MTGMTQYVFPDAESTRRANRVKMEKEYRKEITKIDGEMNINRGVEPTEEQKKAMNDEE